MRKIKVMVEETVTKLFYLEIPDNTEDFLDDAMQIAKEKYENGEFVINTDNDTMVIGKKLLVFDEKTHGMKGIKYTPKLIDEEEE